MPIGPHSQGENLPRPQDTIVQLRHGEEFRAARHRHQRLRSRARVCDAHPLPVLKAPRDPFIHRDLREMSQPLNGLNPGSCNRIGIRERLDRQSGVDMESSDFGPA